MAGEQKSKTSREMADETEFKTNINEAQEHLAALDTEKVELILALHENVQKNLKDEEREIFKTWVDNNTLHRYLRARNFNLKDAEKMLRESLAWRASYKPHLLRAKDVQSQIVMGHLYTAGTDLLGRPILIFKCHTVKDPHDTDERIKFCVYTLEKVIKRMSPGIENMVWFVDCRDFNVKYNGDLGLAKKFGSALQDHYPERLGEVIYFDAPGVFKTFFKMISPFIDARTKKKNFFVETNDSKLQEKLSKKFDLSQVEKTFGGTKELDFNGEAYLKDLMSDE